MEKPPNQKDFARPVAKKPTLSFASTSKRVKSTKPANEREGHRKERDDGYNSKELEQLTRVRYCHQENVWLKKENQDYHDRIKQLSTKLENSKKKKIIVRKEKGRESLKKMCLRP
jgi:hypothetical protein